MSATTGVIHTEKGQIHFELSDATVNTSKNFVTLAQNGFYDGVTFHRVIDTFVLQGGDPYSKSGDGRVGTGGPGYSIKCETAPDQRHEAGAFSMAHAGLDTGGSQFFVVLTREATTHLDGKHTVFGKTTSGMDVVQQIIQGDVMTKVEITNVSPVVQNHSLLKGPAR
ncbi:MAG: peptidylprolyl isomerase [Candidatus Kariarchaeaceae archaeon]|jgi:peptidyl-prolyl cis-trans isomerase B (cyclophilin B)